MSTTRRTPTSDFLDCPCRGVTLDKLIQPAILALLAAGPLHGYLIAKKVGEMPLMHGREPDASGVYRFLRAMLRKGLVVAAWDLSEKGPAKRCYEITDQGRACLGQWVATLEGYRQGIGALLKLSRRAVGSGRKAGERE